MHDGMLVIDADSHKMENPIVFFDYLDPSYRDRLGSRIDRWGQQRLVVQDFNPATGRADLERVFPQPEGPGKGAFCAIHPETAIGGVFITFTIKAIEQVQASSVVQDLKARFDTLDLNALRMIVYAIVLLLLMIWRPEGLLGERTPEGA